MPAFIPVVGTNNGTPNPGQSVTITVRDFFNSALINLPVEIDFSQCSGIRVCQVNVGGTVSCAVSHGKVFAYTNTLGQVTLTVLGGGTNTDSHLPADVSPCVVVRASGINLQNHVNDGFTQSYFTIDENGAGGGNGVTGVDGSLCQGDVLLVGTEGYKMRSDFNADGTLTGIDNAKEQEFILMAGSIDGCATEGPTAQPYCP